MLPSPCTHPLREVYKLARKSAGHGHCGSPWGTLQVGVLRQLSWTLQPSRHLASMLALLSPGGISCLCACLLARRETPVCRPLRLSLPAYLVFTSFLFVSAKQLAYGCCQPRIAGEGQAQKQPGWLVKGKVS